MRAFRSKDERIMRPLLIALILFLAAVSVKALLFFAEANRLDYPAAMGFGSKTATLLTTIGVVFILRWLIADAPLKLLRKYTVTPILKTLITLLIYFGAAMYLLHKLLGINMLPLLTTSAVLTGIMALSLQETLKNLFTGLWINTERVVARGDWIRVGDTEGQVMEVTWRTTRLLTRSDDHIILPNRIIAESILENLTYPTALHMVELDISASYNDPPNRVRDVLYDVALNTPEVLKDPKPEILILSYGDFAINYRVRAYISEYINMMTVKSEVNRRIWYAFKRNNIEIPFPIRTLYHRSDRRPAESGMVLNQLREMDFLKVLKEEDLARVAQSARIEVFGEGESIVRQGETGDTCYFIESGKADVLLAGSPGRDGYIATLGQGDFFGEMSLLAGEPRKATVVAREDIVCIVIGSEAFKSIFENSPEIAERFSEALAKRTAELEEVKVKASQTRTEIQASIMHKIKRFFKIP